MDINEALTQLEKKSYEIGKFVNELNIDSHDCDTFRLCENIDNKYSLNRPLPRITKSSLLYEYLRSCLSHHTAGKDKKYKYDIFYTFPSKEVIEKNTLTQDFNPLYKEFFLNLSELWVKKEIVPFLNNLAKEVRTSTDRFNAFNNARFFLIGDPGAGKTIFLNYLISSYHDDFDNSDTVYIRVDFTKSFNENLDFIDALYLQGAKILKEYYRGEFKLFSDEFKNFIRAKFGISKDKPEAIDIPVDKYLNIFDELLYESSEPINRSFGRYLFDYVTEEMKHNFIFIFDGFDSLSISHLKILEYRNKCKQMIDHVFNEHIVPGVYIISMRNISYEYLVSEFDRTNKLRNARKLKILPANLSSILRNRVKLAASRNRHINEIKKKYPWMEEKHYEIILNSLLRYISSSLNSKEPYFRGGEIDIDKVYDLLENQIFNKNYRKLMEALISILVHVYSAYDDYEKEEFDLDIFSSAVQDNISSKLRRKTYAVMQELLLGRSQYFKLPLSYDLIKEEGVEKIDFGMHEGEGGYLPNIYNFIDEPGEYKQEYRLLLKIRILQMLKHQQTQKRTVVNHIVAIFKYQRLFVEYEIEEMLFTNVLSAVYGATGHGSNYKLKTTDLGNFLLDSFMFNFTYLEQIITNTPLPKELSRLKFVPQFEPSIKTHEWVINYIENVLHFVALINRIEQLERKCFEEYIKANSKLALRKQSLDDNQYGFYPIASTVASNAIKTIKSIIEGSFKYEEQREFKEHVISWLRKPYMEVYHKTI